MVYSAHDSRSSGPGSSPGQGHCDVFLGKTLYSHTASRTQIVTGEFNAGVTLRWTGVPSEGD